MGKHCSVGNRERAQSGRKYTLHPSVNSQPGHTFEPKIAKGAQGPMISVWASFHYLAQYKKSTDIVFPGLNSTDGKDGF